MVVDEMEKLMLVDEVLELTDYDEDEVEVELLE
jgi:hypothetical protein